MNKLVFYYDLLSQPSRALYIFLKMSNIPFEAKSLKLFKMEHLTSEYEAINPFKKVPAIEHNDFKLTESIAIMRYLSKEFKEAERLYPSTPKEQARVDEYLEWQHLNTRIYCASYFRVKYLIPIMKGESPDPEKVRNYEKKMNHCIDLIEHIWLKNKPFIAGDKITVCDIFAACELEQPRMTGYDPCKDRPRLTTWLEEVKKETSPYYEEAHKFVETIIKRPTKQAHL